MSDSRKLAVILGFLFALGAATAQASPPFEMLVPMDRTQTNFYAGYGLVYWALEHKIDVEWALNYRGGSFILKDTPALERQATEWRVGFKYLSQTDDEDIRELVAKSNMVILPLDHAPRIAIYAPDGNTGDVVGMAFRAAHIPFDYISRDDEVLGGALSKYEWIHLHHQHLNGRPRQAWALRDFIEKGGFLFAMCSAADTLDMGIANGANGDWSKTLAFTREDVKNDAADFMLNTFDARQDPLSTILVQHSTRNLSGTEGETSAFQRSALKKDVIVLGETKGTDNVAYIHGKLGDGFWTMLGGHAPNDDGMRLILDNVFVPAAKNAIQQLVPAW